jgi:hypothetical protein
MPGESLKVLVLLASAAAREPARGEGELGRSLGGICDLGAGLPATTPLQGARQARRQPSSPLHQCGECGVTRRAPWGGGATGVGVEE